DPIRFAWNIRERTVSNQQTNYVAVQRSFDPETALTSPIVNEEQYRYEIFDGLRLSTNTYADAIEAPVIFPSLSPLSFPVAGAQLQAGLFCQGLSRDDLGGLRFLFHNENRRI